MCAVIAFRRCPPSIEEAAKIKSPNLFQVENNKMSRDVKGSFLGVRSVSSRVIIRLVRLQLEDELLVQEGCSVKRRMSWVYLVANSRALEANLFSLALVC
jgi:hypothetical protein